MPPGADSNTNQVVIDILTRVDKKYKAEIDKLKASIRGLKNENQKLVDAMGTHAKITKKNSDAISKKTKETDRAREAAKNHRKETKHGNKSLRAALKNFTMFRWALVNVAMALAMVKGVFNFAKWAGEIEQSMYKISAVTKESVADVTNAVENIRKGTIFSLQDVGDALLEVTKKGYTLTQSMAIMESSTKLAVGGFTDLQTAAEIMVNVLKIYNLEVEESERVANVLSYVSLNTAASVEKLAQAMSYVGSIANLAGISMEETSAALGLLMDRIPKSTKAATSLRGVIAKMINPSKEMEERMRELGFSFFDAEENMKSLSRSFRGLGLILKEMGTEEEKLKFIFDLFSIRPAAGAAAMINIFEESVDKLDQLTAAANASESAIESYEKQMGASINVLKSSTEDMKSTFYDFGKDSENIFSKIANSWARMITSREVTEALSWLFKESKITFEELVNALPEDEIHRAFTDLGIGANMTRDQIRDFNKVLADKKATDGFIVSMDDKNTYLSIANQLIKDVTEAEKKQQDAVEKTTLSVERLGFAWTTYDESANKSKKETLDLSTANDKARIALVGVLKQFTDFGGEIDNITEKEEEWLALMEKWRAAEGKSIEETAALREETYEFANAISDNASALEKSQRGHDLLTNATDDYNLALEEELTEIEQLELELEQLKNDIDTARAAGEASTAVTQEETNAFNEAATAIVALSQKRLDDARATAEETEQQELLKEAIQELTEVQRTASKMFSIVNKEISRQLTEATKLYNTYSSARFEGESEYLQQLHDIEQAINQERLAQLQLGDSVEDVNNELHSQQDEYNAWVDTMHEAIRALISEGNLMGENVSDIVKAQQSALLATSRFQSTTTTGTDDELTALEELQRQREIMQLEYELGIGEQHWSLEQFIYALEHEGDVVWSSAQEAMNAMGAQKNEIDELTTTQEQIADEWYNAELAVWQYQNAAASAIGFIQLDIDDMIGALQTAQTEMIGAGMNVGGGTPPPSGGSNGGNGGGGGDSGVASRPYYFSGGYTNPITQQSVILRHETNASSGSQAWNWLQGQSDYDLGLEMGWQSSLYGYPFAKGGLVTNPTRALLGEAGPEMVVPLTGPNAFAPEGVGQLGPTVNIGEIVISGVSGDTSEIAYELAKEIKRQLRVI